MNLDQRIDLLTELGNYFMSGDPGWQEAKQRASAENGWFRPEFIEGAVRGITEEFLQKDKLRAWVGQYGLPGENKAPKNIGLVMAGNIPLVGFHDFLSIFITGHRQTIRPSSKDEVLIKHLVEWAGRHDPRFLDLVSFAEMLKGCDAYIATGSNNSARYFDYYFGKYPHIIRRNRTSVAILDGQESKEELEGLADDVYQYFGLGCRSTTKLYVPENYDFIPLLNGFRKYDYLADYHKYKHNYDYYLTIMILNKKKYMSNESILLEENPSFFSPISALYYEHYRPGSGTLAALDGHPDIQCISGHGHIQLGRAQRPGLTDYADGVDTLQFLKGLGA